MSKSKTSRMGRPPKPANEKQSEAVMLRFTRDERRDLERDAKAAGKPVATFLADLWRKSKGN